MKTMTLALRRSYAAQIRRLRKASSDADRQADRLLAEFAAKACPFKVGNVIAVRELGVRRYLLVNSIDGILYGVKDAKPFWIAHCWRCTKGGERRPGFRRIRAIDVLEPIIVVKPDE